jgi:hypothetical protein
VSSALRSQIDGRDQPRVRACARGGGGVLTSRQGDVSGAGAWLADWPGLATGARARECTQAARSQLDG